MKEISDTAWWYPIRHNRKNVYDSRFDDITNRTSS